eukprot:12881687-Prorocentrum_lima.AAC.1
MMSIANGQKSLLKWCVVIHFPFVPDVQDRGECSRDEWHFNIFVIAADAEFWVLPSLGYDREKI